MRRLLPVFKAAPLRLLCASLALEPATLVVQTPDSVACLGAEGSAVDSPDAILAGASASAATDWRAVCWLAGAHLVTPTLAGALQRKGVLDRLPEEAREYLTTLQALNWERNALLREQLAAMTRALNGIGIEPILLKGAVALTAAAYPGAADRVLGDLDIVVPEARLTEAAVAIERLGYQQVAEGVALAGEREGKHHSPPLVHPDFPVVLELHRRMVHDPADAPRPPPMPWRN